MDDTATGVSAMTPAELADGLTVDFAGVKPFWQSKTLAGLVVAAIGVYAGRHGIVLTPPALHAVTDAVSAGLTFG
ncbi:MAG: hypothetical protein ACXU8U_10435, partial [Asticcacaulis sp.]